MCRVYGVLDQLLPLNSGYRGLLMTLPPGLRLANVSCFILDWFLDMFIMACPSQSGGESLSEGIVARTADQKTQMDPPPLLSESVDSSVWFGSALSLLFRPAPCRIASL